MSKKIIQDVASLVVSYKSGISASQLAKKLNTTTNTITSTLKRANVKLRSNSETAVIRCKQFKQDISHLYTAEVRKKMSLNHADVSGSKNPNFRGKGMMSKEGIWLAKDGNGYARRKAKEHPLAQKDGYIGEHVYQACLKYGIENVKGKDIHHIDGCKSNNSWDNLIALTKSSHRKIENNFLKSVVKEPL